MFILTLIYIIFALIVSCVLVWHAFETKNIYEKIIAAVMLIALILRIFLIK